MILTQPQEIQEIQAFKMIHGIDELNIGRFFCMDEDERTRKLIYV